MASFSIDRIFDWSKCPEDLRYVRPSAPKMTRYGRWLSEYRWEYLTLDGQIAEATYDYVFRDGNIPDLT